MSAPGPSLRLLHEWSPSPAVRCGLLPEVGHTLSCSVSTDLRDGTAVDHDLVLFESPVPVNRRTIFVFEKEPRKLPGFCPERHINLDGSFCLGLPEGDSDEIVSSTAADRWWAKLRGFLRLQVIASAVRRWPDDCSWPHGDAGLIESELEIARLGLPQQVVAFARNTAISSSKPGRLHANRNMCPCGSGKRIRRCHEQSLVRLVELAGMRDRELAKYWLSVKERPCCQTMDGCRLAPERRGGKSE